MTYRLKYTLVVMSSTVYT